MSITLPVIWTHYNRQKRKNTYEHNLLPSLTIPDQSMSVAEILRRFASGLSLEGQRVAQYTEDDYLDGIDLNTLDLAEVQQLKQDIADNIKLMQDDLKKPRKSPQAPQATIQSTKPTEIPALVNSNEPKRTPSNP